MVIGETISEMDLATTMTETPLAAGTVGDQAFLRIRADIIAGTLPPRQKLTLDRLKDTYGVSISTLREILNRLTTEDFVVAEGQRGFEVSPATEAGLREIADLRLLLESHALDLSFAAGDLEWEGRVVAAHHKLAAIERRLLEGDSRRTPEWIAYDWAFHNALISACGSDLLMKTHRSVFDRFLRYHMLAASFRGPAVAKDHEVLFHMALARDAKGARKMLAGHVAGGIEHVLSTGVFG
ncbi:MAG: transcriptional regulator, GntR family [Devosia sp.]|nr:transcriptional regulator, GntR family [Devosia sp.]